MSHATLLPPDLGSFCRLDELGLQVVGQRLEPDRAVLACRVVETDEFARWCRRCGCEATPRDSVTRRLAHEPLGWRPTTLLITIRRYRCTGCVRLEALRVRGGTSDGGANGPSRHTIFTLQAGRVQVDGA
jgi:transposase